MAVVFQQTSSNLALPTSFASIPRGRGSRKRANPLSRFPIVSGLAIQWDHSLPPNQRVKSIHLIKPPEDKDDDLEIESPEDFVDFVEQEDVTRVEVEQRKYILGEGVTREEGGRVYRIVSWRRQLCYDTILILGAEWPEGFRNRILTTMRITREYMAQGYDGFDAVRAGFLPL